MNTERRGFEPPLGVTPKLISSQPPSTTRTPLQVSQPSPVYTISIASNSAEYSGSESSEVRQLVVKVASD